MKKDSARCRFGRLLSSQRCIRSRLIISLVLQTTQNEMRKLATAAFSFTAAIVLAEYFLPVAWLPITAVCLAVLMLPGLFIKGNIGLRIRIISIAAAFGMLWCWGHELLFVQAGESYVDSIVTAEARVLDFPRVYEEYTVVDIKLIGSNMPKLRTALYIYDGQGGLLEPGDIISADLKLKSATKRYGEEISRYTSKGRYLLANLSGEIEVKGKWEFSFLHIPQRMNLTVKNTLVKFFPKDVQGFQLALLTGDTSEMYKDKELSVAMGVSGITHIVSISGMHMAFLIGMVRTFTGKRRRTAAICIPLIIFFISMAGGGASVVRSGIMQIMLLSAPLLRRENDGITSLSFALALLLLANPAAIQDVGLQLSFAAMAGIMLVTPAINAALEEKAGKLIDKKHADIFIRFVISSISGTTGALIFSMPLVAWHFGQISLIAPVANILILSAVSLCFSAGYVLCLAGMAFPALGMALAWVLSWLVRYVMAVVKIMGSVPFAALYTSNYLIGVWLAFTYFCFGICWIMKGKRRFRLPVPLAMSICTLAVALIITSAENHLLTGKITVMDVGQGQSVVVSSGENTVVIDCGGEGWGTSGSTVSSYLLGQNIFKVDALVLTHLHQDHADGAAELLCRLDVRRLIIPPGDSDDDGLLDEILEMADKHKTEVLYLEQDMQAFAGDMGLRLYAPVGSSSMNERGIVVCASLGEFDTLVMGDVNSSTERMLMKRTGLPAVELLIAGHHGSKYSTGEELLEQVRPKYAAISSGNNNYGHPTIEAMERIASAGASIYRTDLSGNITFKVR